MYGRARRNVPSVAVTSGVALPDDISPRNYLSVQRDNARDVGGVGIGRVGGGATVLMLADNAPMVS